MTLVRLPSGNWINLEAITYAQPDTDSKSFVVHFSGDRLLLRGDDAKVIEAYLTEFCLVVH